MEHDSFDIRSQLTGEQRILDFDFTIDPGLVNRRLIETILPPELIKFIHERIAQLAPSPAGLLEVQIDHVYIAHLLPFLRHLPAPSLREAIIEKRGRLICGVERFKACPNIYEEHRTTCVWENPPGFDMGAMLEFTTDRVTSDTTRAQLYRGDTFAFCASQVGVRDDLLVLHPLVLGAPWIRAPQESAFDSSWFSNELYEVFVEDILEFSPVRNVPIPEDFSIMERISEPAFKQCLAEILKESITKDWGGETSDLFSSHLTIGQRRITAAFLLKGPARWRPMTLNHLGKNNDQIYRLSQEPAELLIVQHSHDILPPVRATLRAFTVQPANPRRYCLIDGRDSLRLLSAFGKLDRAIELSNGNTK